MEEIIRRVDEDRLKTTYELDYSDPGNSKKKLATRKKLLKFY